MKERVALDVGSNVQAGTEPEKNYRAIKMYVIENNWDNPFGDGKAGEKILEVIQGMIL